MNIHIGSWIVPLLFGLGFLIYTFGRLVKVKDQTDMVASARKAGWKSEDEAIKAAIAFAYMFRWASFTLIIWIVCDIAGAFFHPLHCGI